jgi:hypothetical protein
MYRTLITIANMQLKWKWPAAFSILNGSNISLWNTRRPVVPCHRHLWELSGRKLTPRSTRHNALPNSKYTAPLLSTSAYIIQTGRNKIWGKVQPPKHNPSKQVYPRYSSGSRVSPVHHSEPLEAFEPQLTEPKPDPPAPAGRQDSPTLSSPLRATLTEIRPEEAIIYYPK